MQAAIRYILRDFARKHGLNVNITCAYAAHDYLAGDIEAGCDMDLILPPVTDLGAARPTKVLTTAQRTSLPSRIPHAHLPNDNRPDSMVDAITSAARSSSSFLVEA